MMPRRQRYWVPGAMYHITSRGNRKSAVFNTDHDHYKYLELLETTRRKYPFILHAYCLMTNHIHLQLETINHPPSRIIHYLHFSYAQYFNRTYQLTGHVFQGRYGAEFIHSIDYELAVSRYIHLNPCEAQIVEKPEDYPWSSYRAYLFAEANPYIETSRTLSYFPNPLYATYQSFVESETDVPLLDFHPNPTSTQTKNFPIKT